MCNGNVRTITSGQQFELAAALVKAVPQMASMPFETAKRWIGDQVGLVNTLSSALMPVVATGGVAPAMVSTPSVLPDIDWSKTYKALGLKFEPGDLVVDPDPSFWDVYVPKGLTPNKLVKVFRDLGVVMNLYIEDLDAYFKNTKRDQKKGPYRVRFKRTVEADPDLAGKSVDDLDAAGIDGITLVERLLLELGYFLTTGQHLDVVNITLCAGSRNSGGRVPSVFWYADGRKLYVCWRNPGRRDSDLCARAAVS